MAKRQKGKVPAHLRPYLFKKKGAKRSRSGGGGGGGGQSAGKGSTMARKKAKTARRHYRRARSGGGGSAVRDIAFVVGGATAAAFIGPKIAEMLPPSLKAAGNVGGAVLVGALGFFALRKFNRTAALGFAAASIAPAVASMVAKQTGGVAGLGAIGDPDGVAYLNGYAGELPQLSGSDDELSGSDELEGLGAFTPEIVEV